MSNNTISLDEQLEKSYDYITNVLQCQNKPLNFSTMYGDGSIHGFNKGLFKAVYKEILYTVGWEAIDDLQ